MARDKRKRLSTDLPIEMHKQLEMIARRRNITLTRLIMRLAVKAMEEERRLER